MRSAIQVISEVRFEIFGDESFFQEIATYGLVVVPTQLKHDVEFVLSTAKENLGIEATARLHCRELFNDNARAKSPLRHLTLPDIFPILQGIACQIEKAGVRCWLGYITTSTVPDGFEIEWRKAQQEIVSQATPGNLDKLPRRFNFKGDKKQLIHFAYLAAMGPVLGVLPGGQVAAWVDPDFSKVDWVMGRQQANLLKSFFPIDHNDQVFKPSSIVGDKPLLLDVADILAYCGAHALCAQQSRRKAKFQSVVNAFRPGFSQGRFGIVEGPFMSVQSNTQLLDEFRTYFGRFTRAC